MRRLALLGLAATAAGLAASSPAASSLLARDDDNSSASSGGTIWATPHDSYSSSIGVLGCKIDTNRVAYWPASPSCSNICVSLSYGGRSVYLLRIDQSGGAHDVSYDAWNYLMTGKSARDAPTAGGAIAMQYRDEDPSACASLIHTDGNKLPLSAANSMNFLSSCLADPSSWVAKNYVLYNIMDPLCSYGFDETCTLDLAKSNQAQCAHPLGDPVALTSDPVYNIRYPTGQVVLASNGQPATAPPPENGALSLRRVRWTSAGIVVLATAVRLLL